MSWWAPLLSSAIRWKIIDFSTVAAAAAAVTIAKKTKQKSTVKCNYSILPLPLSSTTKKFTALCPCLFFLQIANYCQFAKKCLNALLKIKNFKVIIIIRLLLSRKKFPFAMLWPSKSLPLQTLPACSSKLNICARNQKSITNKKVKQKKVSNFTN